LPLDHAMRNVAGNPQGASMSTGVLRLGLALVWLALPALAEAKTLVYCSEASPETFNPMVGAADSTMDAAAKPLFNRLVEFKPGTTEIGPALAESWDISGDGTVYTFHLRSGVKFHAARDFAPTRAFNADDVVYSFERQRSADNPYHKLSGANYQFFGSTGLAKLIRSIEKMDDLTVRFTLNNANVTFLSNIALDFASILSLEYAQAMTAQGHPELIDQQPIGTGPFILVEFQKDSLIRYRANPDYWGGAPKLDALVFAITPDPAVRIAKLRAGECQVTTQPPPADIPALAQDPAIELLREEGQNIGYLGFNVEKPPLTDKRVRRALALAINKPAIIDAIYLGSGKQARTVLPPTEWGSAQSLDPFPSDPNSAKALLAEAGYPAGFSISLWAMPVSRPYNPNARRMAELIQADWAAIGVKAEIVSYEWAVYLKKTQEGEQDAFLLGGTSNNGDPDDLLTNHLSCAGAKAGSNRTRWCFKPYDDLLDQARRIAGQGERKALYVKAQELVREEVPLLPIAHSLVFMPIRKEVRGYVLDPFGRQNFARVDLAN
jgi:dipeptide transport system substrate-binding protein